MSSQRKIDSARANGAKSHGPITEQGRKKSSMNALKLGLTARTVVFPNENHDEYDAVLDSYIQHLQPTDPVEMDLVVEMVNAKWQQRRLNNTETEMFDLQMVNQKEELDKVYEFYDEVYAHTFAFEKLSESASLQMLHRTLSRLERTYSRALNNLLRLRKTPKSNSGASIQKDEKRTQSQDRTPTTDHELPLLEAQTESNPTAPQPSVPPTAPESSDPAAGT
jgi:hypothetical protein